MVASGGSSRSIVGSLPSANTTATSRTIVAASTWSTPRTPGCRVATNAAGGSNECSSEPACRTRSIRDDETAMDMANSGRCNCAASRGAKSRPSGDAGITTTGSSARWGASAAAHAAGLNSPISTVVASRATCCTAIAAAAVPEPTSTTLPPHSEMVSSAPAGNSASRTTITASIDVRLNGQAPRSVISPRTATSASQPPRPVRRTAANRTSPASAAASARFPTTAAGARRLSPLPRVQK